jgi:hypothetical protein
MLLFEVADFSLCLQLFTRLERDWPARLVGRTESRFVAVELDPASQRMEALRDSVARWAFEVGFPSVRYHVGEQMFVVLAAS